MDAERPATCWVLNLDADLELETRGPWTPPARLVEKMRAVVPRLRGLVGPDDVVLGEGEVLPPGRRGMPGRAWCPTTRALRRLRDAGAAVPDAPSMDVLRHVAHRRFALALLRESFPDAAWLDTPAAVAAYVGCSPSPRTPEIAPHDRPYVGRPGSGRPPSPRTPEIAPHDRPYVGRPERGRPPSPRTPEIAPRGRPYVGRPGSPTGRFVLKRAFGHAGRGQRRVGRALGDADRAWIDASLARDVPGGAGLLAEPWVERTIDVTFHGHVAADGAVRLGAPCVQTVDARGAWQFTRRAHPGELPDPWVGALRDAARRAADLLAGAGYFGPFGMDGFGFRDQHGADRFRPCCDLNARYTTGWGVGFEVPQRPTPAGHAE